MRLQIAFVFIHFISTWLIRDVTASQPTDPYYIAGVVEFPVLNFDYTTEDIKERLSQFGQLIDNESVRPDIVVFPEDVLNTNALPMYVPDPLVIVPCLDENLDFILTEMSCYARSLELYVLISVVELYQTADETFVYKTSVVFDRKGQLISRYRKYNLQGNEWKQYDYPEKAAAVATFTTDFNVTFGHLTGMDLFYQRPAQELLAQGVTDFVLPSRWTSELPFMTALQLHQSWAYRHNVNLLVASANDPRNGISGTGLYVGQHGAVNATISADEQKRIMLVTVVPKRYAHIAAKTATTPRAPNRITGISVTRDSDIDLYTTLRLPPIIVYGSEETMEMNCCDGRLCCTFRMKRFSEGKSTEGTYSYQYRVAAFEGVGKLMHTEPERAALCVILACTGDHLYTCGRIHTEEVDVEPEFTFNSIVVSANFTTPNSEPHMILPSSVNDLLQPLPVNEYSFTIQNEGDFSYVEHALLQPKSDLLAFGIFVNYFLDDTEDDQHGKGTASHITGMDYMLCPLLILVYGGFIRF